MAEEDIFDDSPKADVVIERDRVSVTLKAGPYEAPWIVLRGKDPADIQAQFDDSLAELMKSVAQAQASFIRLYDAAKGAKVAAKGQAGKPAGAGNKVEVDIPFAPDDGATSKTTCSHGDRTRVEHKGKVGWICVLPQGSDGRCETIFE